MLSWQELDQQFQGLSAALSSARIDVQWGAAGEHLRLAAYFDVLAKERFVALSRLAGEKIIKCLPADSDSHLCILAEPDSALRWWKALWHLSRGFEFGFVGFQKSDTGEDEGKIYTGSIKQPAQSSANLALDLLARYGEPTATPKPVETGSPTNWRQRLLKSLSLKPGAFGVSVDLKEFFTRKKG